MWGITPANRCVFVKIVELPSGFVVAKRKEEDPGGGLTDGSMYHDPKRR